MDQMKEHLGSLDGEPALRSILQYTSINLYKEKDWGEGAHS